VFQHRPFRCIVAALIVLGMHVCGCCAVYGHGCIDGFDGHTDRQIEPVGSTNLNLSDCGIFAATGNTNSITSIPGHGGSHCNCTGDRWPMTVESSRTAVPAPDLVPAAGVLDILPPRVMIRPAFSAGDESPRRTSSLLRLHCALLI